MNNRLTTQKIMDSNIPRKSILASVSFSPIPEAVIDNLNVEQSRAYLQERKQFDKTISEWANHSQKLKSV
jgi:hypothetical protein